MILLIRETPKYMDLSRYLLDFVDGDIFRDYLAKLIFYQYLKQLFHIKHYQIVFAILLWANCLL